MCIKKFDTVIKFPVGVSGIKCRLALQQTEIQHGYWGNLPKPAAGCMREQVKMKRNFGLIHIPELEAIC